MTSKFVSLMTHSRAQPQLNHPIHRLFGNILPERVDGGATHPRSLPDRLQRELGLLIRSASAFAARQTASRGGVAARAGGLGTTSTITTITTPMAGTG